MVFYGSKMLNMLFSMFAYILGSAACHILGLYFINKLYTEFSLYLFIWSLSLSSSINCTILNVFILQWEKM